MIHFNLFQEGALPKQGDSAQRPSDTAQRPRDGLQPIKREYFPAINTDVASFRDTQSFHEVTILQSEVGYICIKEHQSIIDENARLLQELQSAKAAADKTTKACQDLATWTYYERSRLMRELDDANLSRTQDLEQAMMKEKSILAQGAMTFLVQQVNKARAEIALLPLSQEEISLRVGLKNMETVTLREREPLNMYGKRGGDEMSAIHGSADQFDGKCYLDAEVSSSIAEQVDALIAEEEARLAIVD